MRKAAVANLSDLHLGYFNANLTGRLRKQIDDNAALTETLLAHTIPDAVPRDEPIHRASTRPYVVFGKGYTPMAQRGAYRERGRASWYGRK